MRKRIELGHKSAVEITGGRIQELKCRKNWSEDCCNTYVTHYGRKYFLDEFISAHNQVWSPNNPWKEQGFDGFLTDSFFSGVLIKFEGDDAARVYTFISCD